MDIEIRIWDKRGKKMSPPIQMPEMLQGVQDVIINRPDIGEKLKKDGRNPWRLEATAYSIWTGQYDVNGKKIYTDDVVEGDFENEEFGSFVPKSRGKIIFCRDNARFEIERIEGGKPHWNIAKKTKIIGNVYENPELVPGGGSDKGKKGDLNDGMGALKKFLDGIDVEKKDDFKVERVDFDSQKFVDNGKTFIVSSRLKNWDEKSNEGLEDGSKSFPHKGLKCAKCEAELVISNNLWNKKPDRKMIICLECALKEINKHEKKS